jgi:hypothetical protein
MINGGVPLEEPRRGGKRCCCCCKGLNSNVQAVFLFVSMYYLAGSIFRGDLLSIFIYKITKSSEDVGDISGASGIATILLAFPIGYVSDWFRRDTMLRTASVFGVVTLVLTVYVISQLKPGTKDLAIFYITFGLWGAFTVLCNPNLESIFADSVETGTRSALFSKKAATIQVASAAGPFLTIVYYAVLGEGLSGGWKLPQLRIMLLLGTGVCLVSLLFLWLFNDDNSLGHESETKMGRRAGVEKDILIGDKRISLIAPSKGEELLLEANEPEDDDELEGDLPCCFVPRHIVPYVIAIGDFGTAVGAGMTVKFFPLFFVDRYLLSPIALSIIYFVNRIMTAGTTMLAQKIAASKYSNRVAVMVGAKIIGTCCLYAMALYDPEFQFIMVMAPLYMIRTSVMNGVTGLKRSILMDCVPKKSRAKWNSFESITRFTWSGSAALGGFLVQQYTYKFCFLVTAVIYTIATGIFCLLFAADVPREKNQVAEEEKEDALLVAGYGGYQSVSGDESNGSSRGNAGTGSIK